MFYQEPAEGESNLLQKIIQGTNEKRKLLGYQPAYANAKDLLDLTREIMGQTDEQRLVNQQLLEEELRMRRGYQ
ncbi:hypothetical protein N9C98_01355 [Synechococcus sp. AH-224-G16]|nr:hypothetical protein [Synechococcus sp. AH-224-G16]